MSIEAGAQVAIILLTNWTLCGHCNCWDRFVPWVELPVQRRLCPIFHEWCRVIQHSQVFYGLMGCQRTPGIWGVTKIPPQVSLHITPISSLQLLFRFQLEEGGFLFKKKKTLILFQLLFRFWFQEGEFWFKRKKKP